MVTLLPPVSYQGGKQRKAADIVTLMGIPTSRYFYDICCGSGAISVAAVMAGQAPETIQMIDASPWGKIWELIGNGKFDILFFRECCDHVPRDPRRIKEHMEALFSSPIIDDAMPYVFLLLQSAAIGGSPISYDGSRFIRSSGFRDYWQPTATSSRRSPVNPMMPMVDTIFSRVDNLVRRMRGVQGVQADVTSMVLGPEFAGSVLYIDPPYVQTTSYPHKLEVMDFLSHQVLPWWVSEGKPLSSNSVCISKGETKGGITGDRKRFPHEEWLSYVEPISILRD
jgi:hypothetical protein